jgi:hypothetical protein
MRAYLILLLAIGPALTTCDENVSVPPEPGPPETGVRLTTTTTGVDLDADGYRVTVDGSDIGVIPANDIVFIRLDPGSRTIALSDLAPNCSSVGNLSQTVTILDTQLSPVTFALTCIATTGVISIAVQLSGTAVAGKYEANVDGRPVLVSPSRPAYLNGVSPGIHVISLMVAPPNCTIQTGSLSVTVTAGQLVRDTVEATFAVACVSGNLRITAHTTGPTPTEDYHVWVCNWRDDCYEQYWTDLGALGPNGFMTATLPRGSFWIELSRVPANCDAQGPSMFTVRRGERVDLEYTVACS